MAEKEKGGTRRERIVEIAQEHDIVFPPAILE